MNTLLSILSITNTPIAKATIASGFGVVNLQLFQSNDITQFSDFTGAVLNNIPAQIMYVLGIMLGVGFVVYRLVNWFIDLKKKWKLSDLEVSKSEEALNQERLDTELKRKTL